MTTGVQAHPLLRHRGQHHAKVTFEELFFDLVYVFAVTQLSHALLHHLTPAGAIETLVLWFAVWLGWQYTCWVTNWFEPTTPAIRGMLFGTMLAGLLLAASLPQAFGDRGLVFAAAYVSMQVGRTAFVVWQLPGRHPLSPNFRRMLGWVSVSAAFWIAGAFSGHTMRLVFWACAIACEYLSPMIGFAVPGLGRSRTSDWTIDGAHLAERCQLFVIVALGESLLACGVALADTPLWTSSVLTALAVAFIGTLALWWLYFGTASGHATERIMRSEDPGRIGAFYHYVHAILVAGIILCAVAFGLVLAHPDRSPSGMQLVALSGGPVIYLLGSAIYKRVVYGSMPRSHWLAAVALAVAAWPLHRHSMLFACAINMAILLAVASWEAFACRREVS